MTLVAADGSVVAPPASEGHNYFGNPLKHIGNPLKPSVQQLQKKAQREEERQLKAEANALNKDGKPVPKPEDMKIKPKELAQNVAYNLAVGVATYKILWDPRTKLFRF